MKPTFPIWFAFGIGLLLGRIASAQTPADEQLEVLVSVDVGFNTAYRNGSWVPVDVTVINELSDMTGWVEVRTYGLTGELQSPIYRLPAECPKDSRKRFTLRCYLEDVARVEGWAYEGNRVAVDVPAYVQPQPIDEGDLMAAILDDDPANFGFLYASVQPDEGSVRLHRYSLVPRDFVFLPDFQEAYSAFDMIILGEMDPARVPLTRRRLIAQYARDGGTVVVMTGAYGARFRGTWVEELSGVSVGSSDTIDGASLAEAVFPPEQRDGANASRQCTFLDLEPVAIGVRRFGESTTLATRRPLGRGQVVTFAVDASSHALQDCVGYRNLWREIAYMRDPAAKLEMDRMAEVAARTLPNLSGVSIRPLGSVVVYLMLYLGVGVVGNWLFWNLFKRREMAWICLIPISIGFTGYAMVSGRAGWAESAEFHEIEVLHVLRNRNEAEYHNISGILTARTSRYHGTLARAGDLVRDAGLLGPGQVNPGIGFQGLSRSRPFQFIQTQPGYVNNFRVGASELRLMHIQGRHAIPAGLDGSVTFDDNGGLSGSFTNRSGLQLVTPALYIDGHVFPLQGEGDEWRIDMAPEQVRRTYLHSQAPEPTELQYGFLGRRSQGSGLRTHLRAALFSNDSYQPDLDKGPYLFAWCTDSLNRSFTPDRELLDKTSETLVVAEIDVYRSAVPRRRGTPLYTSRGTGNTPFRFHPANWGRDAIGLEQAWQNAKTAIIHGDGRIDPIGVGIRPTDQMRADPTSTLEVDLLYRTDLMGVDVRFLTDAELDSEVVDMTLIEDDTLEVSGSRIQVRTYRVEDWRGLLRMADMPDSTVQFNVQFGLAPGILGNGERRPPRQIGEMTLVARGIAASPRQDDDEEWSGWR